MILCPPLSDAPDNKIKMARKPEKKQKENLVGCTGKVKDEMEIREGYREDKTVPPVV